MKNCLKIAVMALVMLVGVACTKDGGDGETFLDVTPNNISGVWSLYSYDDGVLLEEGTYLYIEFDRAERTFVRYDNLESMVPRKLSGSFAITTEESAIIRGMYDFGMGDWAHRYYVRDLTATTMKWVATDNENDVRIYVRASLPEGLK